MQTGVHGAELLVEVEGFASHGGWQLDTQFIQQMGSPYLLAHGLGKPILTHQMIAHELEGEDDNKSKQTPNGQDEIKYDPLHNRQRKRCCK